MFWIDSSSLQKMITDKSISQTGKVNLPDIITGHGNSSVDFKILGRIFDL